MDEGTYMRRAMHIIEGLGLKEKLWEYDHPFFGPLFLAATLSIFGYPNITSPDIANKDSFRSLYLVPRLIMGLLAVIDTYLIYKIGEIRYGRKVAFLAAVLFALMPITWNSKKDLPRVHFVTIFVIINPIRNQDQQKRIRCSRSTRLRLRWRAFKYLTK